MNVPEVNESARIAGEILAKFIVYGPWILIPSWAVTRYQLGALASCRGIRRTWITWIPLINVWIPGSLSDRYRMSQGRKSASAKRLLALRLVTFVLLSGFFWFLIDGIRRAGFAMDRGATEAAARYLVIRGITKGLLFLFPATLVWLTGKIMWYITLWDISGLCLPKRCWWHLVLSLIPAVNLIIKPVLLTICRRWAEEAE